MTVPKGNTSKFVDQDCRFFSRGEVKGKINSRWYIKRIASRGAHTISILFYTHQIEGSLHYIRQLELIIILGWHSIQGRSKKF